MGGKLSLASGIGDKLLSKLMKQKQGLAPFLEELYQKEVKLLWKEFVQDGQRQGTIEPDLSVEALLIYLQVLKDGFFRPPGISGSSRAESKIAARTPPDRVLRICTGM